MLCSFIFPWLLLLGMPPHIPFDNLCWPPNLFIYLLFFWPPNLICLCCLQSFSITLLFLIPEVITFAYLTVKWFSPINSIRVLVVKNPPINERDIRDTSLIPGSGRSPGKGHSNPLQYSCLENPFDRGAWIVVVYRVAEGWTLQKQLSTHAYYLGFTWDHARKKM